MRSSSQAILGGIFMIAVDRMARAAFGEGFRAFFHGPIWLLGVVAIGVGIWLRRCDR